ncbi:MAG: folate-binding protein [Betaproteobacteria bacterium]
MNVSKLDQYGLLQVSGEDARTFLHAQLTNDIENLAPGRARYAGWCSAKGRLLATFLVVPASGVIPSGVITSGSFLLQLSLDLVPQVLKRLSMFVLRAKVKITDATGLWSQYGRWGPGDGELLSVRESDGEIVIRVESDRALILSSSGHTPNVPASDWALAEIRAGRPFIQQLTQDQFVPQMVNLELSGGVDFKKGCYPGQEIVARAQYRGAVKRRMVHLRGGALQPGQELYGDEANGQPIGSVVNAAGGESLAVLQVSVIEANSPVRAQPQAAALEVLPLPYSR